MEKTYYKRFEKSELTQCIQGACMLVRQKDLFKVGYFDESIPMFLDDLDLCYRFRIAGYGIFYCADAVITHICSASIKKSEKPKLLDLVVYQGLDIYFLKHNGALVVFLHHLIVFISSSILLLIDLVIIPVLFFWKREYIYSLIEKHFYMFKFSLFLKLENPAFKNYK